MANQQKKGNKLKLSFRENTIQYNTDFRLTSNFVFNCEHLKCGCELRSINDNYCSMTFLDFIFKWLLT